MKEFIIKHKRPCIAAATLAVAVALSLALSLLLTKQPAPVTEPEPDTSSAESVAEITIEAPDSADSSESELLPDSDNYIAPDEGAADKLLSESTPATPAVEAPQITVAPSSNAAASTPSEPLLSDEELKKRSEELQQQTRDKARQYLDEHNIEYATAGFTGENCKRCGKPLWDDNKYAFTIPGSWIDFGIPEDACCGGFCGVIFE